MSLETYWLVAPLILGAVGLAGFAVFMWATRPRGHSPAE
jgi:hypothetical protein